MGVIDKVKGLIGLEDFEEEYEEYEDEEYTQQSQESSNATGRYHLSNVVPMQERKVKAITNAFKLVVIEPTGFEECSGLVDSLKSRKPVIVNLEKLEPDMARKIFDFLGGATYALNGNVQKVANNIFVFAPENVSIASFGEHEPYNFSDSNEDYNGWK